MSAPGRSQALTPEPFKGEGSGVNAPGRSQALTPEPFKGEGSRENVAAIDLHGVVCAAGGRVTLDLPRLRVEAGERVAVIGPNGAGKTTLLRMLGGFTAPREGTVALLGRPMWPRPGGAALRALRAEVGQLPQGLHLVPRLSARENVLIGALSRTPGWRGWLRLPPPALVAAAEAALADVGLAGRGDARADRLSGGERQKVAIARLRLQRPRLVLADEPTAALDPSAALDACRWLQSAAAGATLVTVVHQPALLPALADRVIGMRGGRVAFDRARAEVGAACLEALYAPAPDDPATPAGPSPACGAALPQGA